VISKLPRTSTKSVHTLDFRLQDRHQFR